MQGELRVNAQSDALVERTADIVAAYVTYNTVSPNGLAEVLVSVYAALRQLGQPVVTVPATPVPAVPIAKSIGKDYLISLEDGRRYKTLKRHLTGRGLTPDQYRAKWGLPASYPMVAPNYSGVRSRLAKRTGFGRKAAATAKKTSQRRAPVHG